MRRTGIDLYDATARASASVVIRDYSTSFAWATRLLGAHVRGPISDLYALVRVADELVDGPAEDAGVDVAMRAALLDALEAETEQALRLGYSTNLVVHAFAATARAHGIDASLCRPFFSSMRRDLDATELDAAELDDYVHGSAEVVGLMCLAVFESGIRRPPSERHRLDEGARRLGAAFQKVNFLRDFAEDHDDRGRTYFAGTRRGLTEAVKAEVIATIREDLRAADDALPLLAPTSRAGVWAARAMFGELADRLESTPAATLMRSRVRVPNPVKARILVRALGARMTR